jgi:hypothetical protein
LEKVNDDAVIPHTINLPFLLACDLLRKLLKLLFSKGRRVVRRLVKYAVQVLVQPIKQKAQEFL